MMHLCWIGERSVTGPDPDEAITLHYRESLDRRKATDALAWHRHRLSVTAHGQPVTAANELNFDNFAQRQRSATKGTEILDGGYLALGASRENNTLAADRPSQRLVVDLVGSACNIPSVLGEHHGSPNTVSLLQTQASGLSRRGYIVAWASMVGLLAPRISAVPMLRFLFANAACRKRNIISRQS